MAAKTTSCFTSLKEALLLHTRNPKLFTPLLLLLLAVAAYLVPLPHVVSIQPLTDDTSRASHLVQIKNTGPFSAEYARLLNEIKYDVMKLVITNISIKLVTPALGFVRQIIAFSTASTTYFSDSYSLAELTIHKVIKGYSLKGCWITVTAVALLVALLSAVMRRRLGVLSVQGLVFLLAFLVFLICWNN